MEVEGKDLGEEKLVDWKCGKKVRGWMDSRVGCGVVVGILQVYKSMKCKNLATNKRRYRKFSWMIMNGNLKGF